MGFLGSLFQAKNNFQAQTPNVSFNQYDPMQGRAATPGMKFGPFDIPGQAAIGAAGGGGGDFLGALANQVSGVGGQNYAGAANQGLGYAGQGQGNLQNVYQRQGALSNILGQDATGKGPGATLAQNQLRQATEQGIKQQTGAIANAKGLDPALAARQAIDTGANMTQGAAGQASNLGAQYQLGAQQALGQNLGAMGATAGQQGQLGLGQYGTAGGQGLQALGTLGGLQQGQQQLGVQSALGTGALNLQQQIAQANASLGAQGINAGVAAQNAGSANQWGQGLTGGLLGGVGSFLGLAQGGEVPGYAVGGQTVQDSGLVPDFTKYNQPGFDMTSSAFGHQKPAGTPNRPSETDFNEQGLARGGRIDMRGGGHVPGKAPVPGPRDTERNDIVPARLSPGEIVLPRSVTKRPDAPEKARDFVEHLASRRMRRR